MISITRDLLVDAGGWQVMKEASGIHSAARVAAASYQPPLLTGRVGELHCGLRINSKSDIENLCSCADSRRRGLICAHSVAVGLEIIEPARKKEPAAPPAASPPQPVRFSTENAGPELTLHVIFPPNLAAAWRNDSINVVVEASTGGQRKPFGTVDPAATWRCDPPDVGLAAAFLKFTGGIPASMALLTRRQFAELLTALPGHPRVTFGRDQAATISEEGLRPVLRAALQPDGSLRLQLAGGAPKDLLISPDAAWMFRENTLTAVAPGLPGPYLTVLQQAVTISAAATENFRRREIPILTSFFEIEGLDSLPALPEPPPPPPPPTPRLRLEGSLNFLAATFATPPDSAALSRLQAAGFSGPDKKGELHLKGEPAVLRFFASQLPRLQREWQLEIGERFGHVTRNIERIAPKLEVRGSGEQWFDLSCGLETPGGEQFSSAEIQRLLQSGQSHIKQRDGRTLVFDPDMLEDFSSLLHDTRPEQRSPGLYRMNRREAGSLALFAGESGVPVSGDTSWQNWAGGTRSLSTLQPIPLGDLETVLRPYQKHGAAWMHFLAANHFGGILADEMGLGKTLQTLAFLRTLQGRGPSLVVCPSSLLFNWQAEAARWAPELRILTLEGPQRREKFPDAARADLVLTSYPLLRLDIDLLTPIQFAAVILDEAQHIKNPDSQNAQAAAALRAAHRFVLTGTPVENSVRDLWSLMNFLMPGYLGTRTEFRERFEGPIASSPGGPEQARLARRLRPFLLRRTKQLEAAELPQKIEQVAWCELTGPQREIYQQLAAAARQQLSLLSGAKDQKKARMLTLTALLRLRQAACDARLTGLENPPEDAEASGKLDLLGELLEEALDGGHRVLIFSQFVSMLEKIRGRLTTAGISFCYLDGQSTDRPHQVQQFQSGAAPVFLISLKAGGTGLNLTAADTVIHFDPWWNPAVEAQATDRAHRIGQTRAVTSYKLIARGTVEEKILALQQRKKSVIAATLESEQPMMSALTMDEISELLA